MEQQTLHGPITPKQLADVLIAEFNRGNYEAQRYGRDDHIVVQIATARNARSGGRTATSIHLLKIEDGVRVEMGEQDWFGLAASLGQTALSALRNPMHLIGRLDDLAQDISSLQLQQSAWEAIQQAARATGTATQISERLRRLTCQYCQTANVVGSAHCSACGAPLGPEQPVGCPTCGFVVSAGDTICPECGTNLR